MKLLFICDEYPPGPHGGIGTAVQLLARELVRQGHQVWVAGLYDYGYGGKDYEEDEGVRVYRLRKRSEWLGVSMRYTLYDKFVRKILSLTGMLAQETEAGLQRLHGLIKQLHHQYGLEVAEIPDHQHYTRQVSEPVFFPLPDLPSVVRLHGGNTFLAAARGKGVNPVAREMEKDLLCRATAISSVSRFAANETLAALDLQRHVTIIPNGTVLADLPNPARKISERIVFTGALEANKGVFPLMRAWNDIHAAAPSATLHLYGKGRTAPLRALLNKAAAAQVVFHGHQPRQQVQAALREAEAAIFPSYAETFGLAPLEAMAAGTATIFTTRASGPEIIAHGTDGLLVDPEDVSGMVAAVLSLLSDPQTRQRLAAAGYEKVKQSFTMDKVAKAHIDFYQSLISGQTHEAR